MAYHSAMDRTVYHTCLNCTVGNNIEVENQLSGVPAKSRLCEQCRQLQDENKGQPGIPTPAR